MAHSVLLTGAFGNLGHSTLEKLLEAGHRVSCLDMASPLTQEVAARYGSGIKTFWGDICDPDLMAQAVADVDTVIHLVGIIPPVSEDKVELTRRVNVEGTENVIRAMENSSGAKRLIFASTFGVFGRIQDRTPPLRNDDPVSPTDNYGRTKVAAEEAIRASSLNWSILRICAAPPVEMPKGAVHDPSTIFEASADARIEFVHPEDVSTAFCNAVTCGEAIGRSLFLGGGVDCQLINLDFVEKMLESNGIPGGVPPEAFKPCPVPEFYGDWVDTRESQRLLQFQNYTMDDFIEHGKKARGWKYYLTRLIAPLARRAILKSSPYLNRH